MNKSNCFKAIFTAITFLSMYTINAMQGAYMARAIPVAYNKQTNKWNVLLHRTGTRSTDFWNDFGTSFTQGRANTHAENALKNQTNNLYNIRIQDMPWFKHNNHFIHFLPVKWISGRTLYRQGRGRQSIDFVWIPASELLSQGDISRPSNKKSVNVSRGFLRIFRKYWPQALNQLQSSAQQRVVVPTQGQAVPRNAPKQTKKTWYDANIVPNTVYFYEKNAPFYEFTNFFAPTGGIQIQSIYNNNVANWKTTEHYYQAMKFHNPTIQMKIKNAATPRSVFNLANGKTGAYKAKIRNDWPQISIQTMLNALRAKFKNNQRLKKMLLNTGNKILVEDAGSRDGFYGTGADGKGNNMLGRLLMHVREEIRQGQRQGRSVQLPFNSRTDYQLSNYL